MTWSGCSSRTRGPRPRTCRSRWSTGSSPRNGRVVWVQDEAILVHDGEEPFWQGVLLDITGRKQAEEEERRAISLLQATLESTADGVFAVDLEGNIATSNERFAKMWRLPKSVLDARNENEALSQVLNQLKHPGIFLHKVRELHTQPDAESFDVVEFKDGRVFERYSLPQRVDGVPVERVWSYREITEHRRALERLAEAETKYRTLVEQLPAVVYVDMFDPGQHRRVSETYLSPHVEAMLGCAPEEFMNDSGLWERLLHPDDRDQALARDARHYETGERLDQEYRMIARDGRVVWIHDLASVVRDDAGRRIFSQGVLLDVTERKRSEEALERYTAELSAANEKLVEHEAELSSALDRLRAVEIDRRRLLQQIVGATEEERRRVSVELHDGPIQRLAALDYRLERIRIDLRTCPTEELEELLNRVQLDLRDDISGLRRMMTELRPPVLDEQGLEEALQHHASAVERTSGTACVVDADMDGRLDPALETILYRVAQEALANVVKHAQARKATVMLRTDRASVVLEVRDDGVGFNSSAAAQLLAEGHIGLAAMRERVEMAGGTLAVDSRSGGGTVVRAALPRGPEVRKIQG